MSIIGIVPGKLTPFHGSRGAPNGLGLILIDELGFALDVENP